MMRMQRRPQRLGIGILAPLAGPSTAIFVLLMAAYPLLMSLRNYGLGGLGPDPVLRESALLVDLTWMHLGTSCIAILYGTWLAAKVASSRCPINAWWSSGCMVRRFITPMGKGAIICAGAYGAAMLPAITRTQYTTTAAFPWGAWIFGMTMPAIMFVFGYAIGVFIGNQWALVPSLVVALLYAASGFFVRTSMPASDVYPRHWGSRWTGVLPVVDSGMGFEPGLRLDRWFVVIRCVFRMVVLCSCAVGCMAFAGGYGWKTWKAASVSIITPIVIVGLIIGYMGPRPWVRSEPFMPVCKQVTGVALTICSHPDDTAVRDKYTRALTSFASWFSPKWALSRQRAITVLLGNSFTSSDPNRPYNLTEAGSRMVTAGGPSVIQMHTDTVSAATIDFSDIRDLSTALIDIWLPAECAAEARRHVFDRDQLMNGADVTAFILTQLPDRMDNLAGLGHGYTLTGAARDEAARILMAMNDEQFRKFVTDHEASIGACQVSPDGVIGNAVQSDGGTR